MPRSRTVLAAALIVPALFLGGCLQDVQISTTPPDMKPQMTISATADMDAQPDLAIISAGVLSRAGNAKKANADNRAKMTALFDTLKAAGLPEKDIQTSQFSLNPIYNYYNDGRAPTINGYEVNNMVTVKIRDMDKIGPVMDAMVTVGGNQLNGPIFTIDDPESALNTARQAAITKAMTRARMYADAADQKIVRVLSISEGGGYTPMPPQPVMYAKAEMAMASDAGARVPIAAGEVNMQATVSMTFELAPK